MAERILESELSCPVCLTIFRDPVSLGCGHCFCKHCITEALCHQRDQGRSYTCPMCQAPYEDFPTFLKNFQLSSIVDNYLSMQKNSEDCQILCGDCLDDPKMAVKTCVDCEVSLCHKHVERHMQRNHTLLEPTASVQERKCPQHDKLLEYNCEQDNSCICVTCYIAGPHKGHNIMTLKEARDKHLTTFSETTSSLSASISALSKDIADLNAGLENIAANKVKLCKPIEDLRDRILLLVNGQFNDILKAIIDHQDKTTTEMTAIIKQMEDAKANTQNKLDELNTVRTQPDDLLFVQKCNRLQGLISQQSLLIDTMQVVDVEADKVMMENVENETSNYIVEIGRHLDVIHNVLSQQIAKLVWSGTQRNKVQNQNQVPPIISKKSEKLNLMFLNDVYRHCSYHVTVSNQNKTLTTNSSNVHSGSLFGQRAPSTNEASITNSCNVHSGSLFGQRAPSTNEALNTNSSNVHSVSLFGQRAPSANEASITNSSNVYSGSLVGQRAPSAIEALNTNSSNVHSVSLFGQHAPSANKTLTTNSSNVYSGSLFGRPAQHSTAFGLGEHSETIQCQCKLPVLIPTDIATSKVHCLVDVSMSNHWGVGVTDKTTQVSRYLQWKHNSLSYESNTSLSLGSTKINVLKMQIDFETKLLAFYDAGNQPETPILICKCDNIFPGPLNVGFNILQGSLSLI